MIFFLGYTCDGYYTGYYNEKKFETIYKHRFEFSGELGDNNLKLLIRIKKYIIWQKPFQNNCIPNFALEVNWDY
jgi:hypothetical protein